MNLFEITSRNTKLKGDIHYNTVEGTSVFKGKVKNEVSIKELQQQEIENINYIKDRNYEYKLSDNKWYKRRLLFQ